MTVKKQPSRQNLIFIVEDNELYSFMLEYMLSEVHMVRCLRFEKGEECIRNLALEPDMIILDYVLPGIDGLDTFRKIKQAKPEVPVVVLTGNFDSHAAQHFMEEGVYDYMLKEESAAGRIKSLVEFVMGKKNKEEEIKEEQEGRQRIVRISLLVFFVFALAISITWLIIG
jgi:DNA-binding NtrC family response regulator